MRWLRTGDPRYTGDIDIWVHPTPPNVSRLLEVVRGGERHLHLISAPGRPDA